ncbi:MAG: hypothetical protein HFG54_06740 [Lachnospiraceae bacterium]|jgi:hypothetical protein|nr:hypothetical protein [Lachnospiraceae bacterium]
MEYYQKSSYRSGGRYQKKSSGNLPGLFLFYILPFIVFNGLLFYCVTSAPKISLELRDTNDYLTSEATMTIDSWFPTKKISVNMDGEILELTKGKRRSYTVPVTRNGVLEATVVNLNGMSSTVFRHVNILDDNPPSFENASLEDGLLTLRVSDSQSLVNPDSVYATDSVGQQRSPLSVERIENQTDNTIDYELQFDMDLNGLHVFIQDKAGNEAQKTFYTHKEGNLDVLEVDSPEEETNDIVVQEEGETPSDASDLTEGAGNETSSIVIE